MPEVATKDKGCKVSAAKKTKKGGQDVTVQLTNNSSILSKYSISKLGYFPDKFLKYFVDRDARRSPLINRGYYVRAKAVDFIVKQFLSVVEEKKLNCQIVSLGAGFDTLFFRLHSQGLLKHATVFEVDFPDVVKNKVNVIMKNEELYSSIGEIWKKEIPCTGIWTDHYRLTGCDLKELDTLSQLLIETKTDMNQPTLLLSECALTYMEPKDSSAVISWASKFFKQAVFITYEQICPRDSFGLVMQNHYNNLNSPLLALNSYPDAEAQINRYKSLGWNSAVYHDMNHFYNKVISKQERQRVETLEIFDEFEEWHLKCSHYIILGAFSESFQHALPVLFPDPQTVSEQEHSPVAIPLQPVAHNKDLAYSCSFARFGHTLSWLESCNTVVMVGGFGEKKGCHQRLSQAVCYKYQNGHLEETCQADVGERMFHTATSLSDDWVFIYGGRKSPMKPCSSTLMLQISTRNVNSDFNANFQSMEIQSSETKVGESVGASTQDSDACSVKPSEIETATESRNCKTLASSSADNFESSGIYNDDTSVRTVGLQQLSLENKTQDTMTVISTVLKTYNTDTEPPCRWRHSATRITQPDGSECVLVFGGKNQTDSALGDCYIFSVKEQSWNKAQLSELVEPRHSHCATLWKSRYIVLSGGVDKDSLPLSLLQVIDTQSQPMKVETLHFKTPLLPRYSHTAHIRSDELTMIGGVSLQTFEYPVLTVIDLNNLTFSTLDLKPPGGAILMLDKHDSCEMDSGKILITGGGGNCFSFGTHLNHEPVLLDLHSYLEEYA